MTGRRCADPLLPVRRQGPGAVSQRSTVISLSDDAGRDRSAWPDKVEPSRSRFVSSATMLKDLANAGVRFDVSLAFLMVRPPAQ